MCMCIYTICLYIYVKIKESVDLINTVATEINMSTRKIQSISDYLSTYVPLDETRINSASEKVKNALTKLNASEIQVKKQ